MKNETTTVSLALLAGCAIGLLVGCGTTTTGQSEKRRLASVMGLQLYQSKGPFSIYISKNRQAPYEEFAIFDGSGLLIWRNKTTNEVQTLYFRRSRDILDVVEGLDGNLKRVACTLYDAHGRELKTYYDTKGRGEWDVKFENGRVFLRDETVECWKLKERPPTRR